jgi:hypothetical protein
MREGKSVKHEREKVIIEIMSAFNLAEKDKPTVQDFVDGIYFVGKEDAKQEMIDLLKVK